MLGACLKICFFSFVVVVFLSCGGGGGGSTDDGGGTTDGIGLAKPTESGTLKADEWLHRKIVVPAGASKLQVDLDVGSGSVELLLKYAEQVTEQIYWDDAEDCYTNAIPQDPGQCVITLPSEGEWYIGLWADSDSSYTMNVSLQTSNDQQTPEDNFEIVSTAQQTIGTDGGEIVDTSGAKIRIESGGFASNTKLTVSTVENLDQENNEYTAAVVTKTYRLEGLPDDSREPITLSLPLTGTTSHESYIVIEYDAMQSSPLREGHSRELLPAQVIDGYLIAELPPYGDQNDPSPFMRSRATPDDTTSGFRNEINYHGLSMQYSATSINGNFRLTFPAWMVADNFAQIPDAVAKELEETLAFIENDLQIPYSCRDTQRRPIQVAFFPFTQSMIPSLSRSPSAWAYSSFSPFSRNRDTLEFNDRLATSSDALAQFKATASHELFHLVQGCYAPVVSTANYWINEASSVWIEMQRTTDPEFWPSVLDASKASFINDGLFRSHDSNTGSWESHGYASALFLHFLTYYTDKGNDFMKNLWLHFNDNTSSFYQATQDVSWERHWGQFVEAFYGSLEWSDLDLFDENHMSWINRILLASEYTFTVPQDEIDQSYSFTSYPLSGQSVRISVPQSAYSSDEQGKLVIKSDGLVPGVKIKIFDSEPAYGIDLGEIAHDDGEISYENLERIAQKDEPWKRNLVAVLIDSRSPTASPINVTMTLEFTKPTVQKQFSTSYSSGFGVYGYSREGITLYATANSNWGVELVEGTLGLPDAAELTVRREWDTPLSLEIEVVPDDGSWIGPRQWDARRKKTVYISTYDAELEKNVWTPQEITVGYQGNITGCNLYLSSRERLAFGPFTKIQEFGDVSSVKVTLDIPAQEHEVDYKIEGECQVEMREYPEPASDYITSIPEPVDSTHETTTERAFISIWNSASL